MSRTSIQGTECIPWLMRRKKHGGKSNCFRVISPAPSVASSANDEFMRTDKVIPGSPAAPLERLGATQSVSRLV